MRIETITAGAKPLAGFVELLRRCADGSAQKRMIMGAHAEGALNDDECELLIGALLLEAS